jgi:hypothetical protein
MSARVARKYASIAAGTVTNHFKCEKEWIAMDSLMFARQGQFSERQRK